MPPLNPFANELLAGMRHSTGDSQRQALPRSFYDRDVEVVARELLGKKFIRATPAGITIGRIVEVEAYVGQEDPASHSYRGRTRRNAVMFGPPGRAYVYAIHSRFCVNAVTQPTGIAHAVLIRAVEPLEGLALMQQRRGCERALDLARGPARLCEAMDIDRRLDGWDLTQARRLWIADGAGEPTSQQLHIQISPRIGVTSAKDRLLRFFLDGNPYVSGPRRFHWRAISQ